MVKNIKTEKIDFSGTEFEGADESNTCIIDANGSIFLVGWVNGWFKIARVQFLEIEDDEYDYIFEIRGNEYYSFTKNSVEKMKSVM